MTALGVERDDAVPGDLGLDRCELGAAPQRDLLEHDAVRQVGALDAVHDRSAPHGDLVGRLLGETVAAQHPDRHRQRQLDHVARAATRARCGCRCRARPPARARR